ncbi:MAG: 30S ribosomal protein S6 [bacterium]
MNKYEALFIFPESLKDETLEAALGRIRAEIEKADGKVESTTRLGRRPFARPLNKQQAGQYMVVTFLIGGEKIRPLHARFKLNEDIFRVQLVRVPEAEPEVAATTEVEK